MSHRTPSYRLHKPTGRAVVTLAGRDVYLGKYGSEASRLEYDRLVAEWLVGGRGRRPAPGDGTTVAEVILAYMKFAETYYRDPEGGPSREVDNVREAMRPLKRLYGHTEAAAFGPLAFKAVRETLVGRGLCRSTINSAMGRVRRMFKWAVANEMVPPSVYHGLQAVDGLRAGRGMAREPVKVEPVSEDHVRAVLPLVTPPVRAMIEIQWLCGARPGEVMRMRGCDIDRSGPVWVYRPSRHKTQNKGKGRAVLLGPKAQAVLGPWLKDDPAAHLFSPREAVALRYAERRAARKTKVQPSQMDRRKAGPRRAPGERFDKNGYRKAIARACLKAGIPVWHPHRLRHSAATRIRAAYGLEAAQVVLGHSRADVTEVYAERDLSKGILVMGEVG